MSYNFLLFGWSFLTNGANYGGSTIIGLWLELGFQAGEPFNLSLARGHMRQGVRHVVLDFWNKDGCNLVWYVFVDMKERGNLSLFLQKEA